MISEDTLFLPITQQSRLIKRKKLSPVELTEAYLSRIRKLDPRLHAFVTVTSDLATQQAEKAEKAGNVV